MTLVQPRRRHRRNRRILGALLVVGAAATSGCSHAERATPPASRAPSATQPTEAEIRDLDIEFYAARVKADPRGAANLARLASLYLQRSRETGDPRDAIRAEEAARRSMRNRHARNEQAMQVLASALLAQHRFVEALQAARAARDRNPDAAPLRAAVAEIEMELGQYDSARVTFAALGDAKSSLSVAPRLARWAEIRGHPDEARRLIRSALAVARRDPSLPREQVAWFWLRSGDIELRAGNMSGADSAYRGGLRAHPGDYRLLAAMCRLASVEHRWADAVEYGESAIASNLDPATLGMLSDAYAAQGDTSRSQEYARALDVAVLKQPGAYHRAWSLFLLDHDRHVGSVYKKIRTELATRHDVYGYDLLGWALHKLGRNAEALDAMAAALSQGTKDAQLFYHAGIIERSLGHSDAADRLLSRARSLNSYVDGVRLAAR
jgi:tetratricopeptide (TPR) repeat protein